MNSFIKSTFISALALLLVSTASHAQDTTTGRLPSKAGAPKKSAPISEKVIKRTPQAWEINGQLQMPESIYFDPASKTIFVSNINGAPTTKDGNGWIGIVHLTKDGTGPDGVEKMIEGLNAPKGMRAFGGTLWVTDIDEIVAIDLANRKVSQKIPVPDAKFLNDIAIDDKGKVYFSDTITSAIYTLTDGKPTLFAAGPELQSPNGLLFHGGKLYVAAWGLVTDPETFASKDLGHLYSIDLKSKKITNITKKPLGNLDGLERSKSGHFIVSDWKIGKVYKVDDRGRSSVIAEGIKNAADIGLKDNLVLVPAMTGNSMSAYYLK